MTPAIHWREGTNGLALWVDDVLDGGVSGCTDGTWSVWRFILNRGWVFAHGYQGRDGAKSELITAHTESRAPRDFVPTPRNADPYWLDRLVARLESLAAAWRGEAVEREARAALVDVVGVVERHEEGAQVLRLRRCADELDAELRSEVPGV